MRIGKGGVDVFVPACLIKIAGGKGLRLPLVALVGTVAPIFPRLKLRSDSWISCAWI